MALAADLGVDLWALDEVHFQQHGSRCRMWIAPEDKDPVVRHEPTRKSIGYFGAVRLRDGLLVTRREDLSFNAQTFWADLQAQFALDFLPPYSPQLNPIERVWKLLRRLRLHNQHFRTLEEVTMAVQAQFETWSQPNDPLRKLCSVFG